MGVQHGWYHIKIKYYEKDYYRHFMSGIFCQLCSGPSGPASGSAGSTCTTSSTSGPIGREVKENVVDDYMTCIVI